MTSFSQATTEISLMAKSFQPIAALLWQGRLDEARSAAERLRAQLQQRQAVLEAELFEVQGELQVLEKLMPPETFGNEVFISSPRKRSRIIEYKASGLFEGEAGEDQEVGDDVSPLDSSERRQRRSAVLAIARQLGMLKKSFTTDDVAAEVMKQGINMGVPDNRINTAIGNIVVRSGDFVVIDKGLYRLPKADFLE